MTQAEEEPLLGGMIAHLLELRQRLLRGVIGFGLVLLALLPMANHLYALMAEPLLRVMPKGGQIIATQVASPFVTPLKLAFFVALMISMPWLLYQAWAFVAPGLFKRERKLAVPMLVAALGLFYTGCAFAYYLVLPTAFGFLSNTLPAGVAMMTDISAYLDFVLVIFLAFGLSFELPIALLVAVMLGAVTPKQLAEWRGYAIVAIFAVAAVITPPDVVSQLLLAVPLCALYEIGLLFARLLYKSRAAERANNAS